MTTPSTTNHSTSATFSAARLEAVLDRAVEELLVRREPGGHWTGNLSSSALSTATAVTALAIARRESRERASQPMPDIPPPAIQGGLSWLARNANADGGWGDTTLSLSNLSTTALCWAAFGAVPGADAEHRAVVERAEAWLGSKISLPPAARLNEPASRSALAKAIIARYGKDRTFSVPILTLCALAGRLGPGRRAWEQVIPLPFELAALPHQWFAALRLPVVSYALPALIAIGHARHFHRPSRNPVARLARVLAKRRALRVLGEIQPTSGGFLEATPLTSFVVMSLAASGQVHHPTTAKGVEFLLKSQRADGSWPIDTNLATWVTTLAVDALSGCRELHGSPRLEKWLLSQQYRTEHPYTHAAPGGWAWTDLPGGVPDADDTAGAVLALVELRRATGTDNEAELRAAAGEGIKWLLGLQNRDGGIPTFCRGWGTLPFDRSSADLTAHALRAWLAWFDEMPAHLRQRMESGMARALQFLATAQRQDGAWTPLWFGNQHAAEEENPTYGTARVVEALCAARQRFPAADTLLTAACRWLLAAQNVDGGWGGAPKVASSVEETALAVAALASVAAGEGLAIAAEPEFRTALVVGTNWLLDRVESGEWRRPAPIGFYFAKLWYYEELYPLIFTVDALRRAAKVLKESPQTTQNDAELRR